MFCNERKRAIDKTYSFAVMITKFCFEIQQNKKEFVISRQLLKSGTSIGAYVEEAQGAISKAEFIAKMQFIALKEAKDTKYWLRFFSKILMFTETKNPKSALLHESTVFNPI